MSDIARASLPVAILLLVLAGTARAALWAQLDDPRATRLARRYLEPLSTWCLVAVATNLFAVSAAGNAGVLSVGVPLALGAAALMLRSAGEQEPAAQAKPAPQRPKSYPTASPGSPVG